MADDTVKSVRKKACPFCGKKLQHKSRRQWCVNLARHLGNSCPPYEREQITAGTRAIWELLKSFPQLFPAGNFVVHEKTASQEEIAELERIANLKPEDLERG